MNVQISSRRQFLRTIALAGFGLAAAACVPVPEISTDSAAAGEEPVGLSLWGWWDTRMAHYRSVADQFAKQSGRITVDVDSTAGGYPERIYSSLAAGAGPNMLKMPDLLTMHQMREENLLLQFPEDIFPLNWFRVAYPFFDTETNGRYVLPTGSSCTLLMYNKRMFAEAGLDPESPPTTWSDFTTAAKALTRKDASGAIAHAGLALTLDWPVLNQIYQLGGNVIHNSGDEQTSLMTSPEVHEAFTYIADLARTHEVWHPSLPDHEAVGKGRAAMTEEQTWAINEFAYTYPDIYPDIGYSHPPTPTGAPDPLFGYKDIVTSISALTGRPQNNAETWQFMEYLYKDGGKEAYRDLCLLSALAPERADLMSDPLLMESPGLSKAAEVNPRERSYGAVPYRASAVLHDVLHLIVSEGRSVTKALDYGETEIQKIINEGLAKYWV